MGFDDAYVSYSLFDKNRKMINRVTIPTTTPRMLHDFAITENYIIIPDLPMESNIDKVFNENRLLYQLNVDAPARYGIMKRHCQDPDQTQWFELPYHYCFHYANAWEETNELGQQVIVLWGCLT